MLVSDWGGGNDASPSISLIFLIRSNQVKSSRNVQWAAVADNRWHQQGSCVASLMGGRNLFIRVRAVYYHQCVL